MRVRPRGERKGKRKVVETTKDVLARNYCERLSLRQPFFRNESKRLASIALEIRSDATMSISNRASSVATTLRTM